MAFDWKSQMLEKHKKVFVCLFFSSLSSAYHTQSQGDPERTFYTINCRAGKKGGGEECSVQKKVIQLVSVEGPGGGGVVRV